jgi:hypothetical protein
VWCLLFVLYSNIFLYCFIIKISWTWLGVQGIEHSIGYYNHKCRTFYQVEPAIQTLAEPVGFSKLKILKNGKLRVKYLDENNTALVMDLPKTA